MNAIIYNFIQHKKINGTLFYCFEYYCFLKRHVPDVKFIIFNCDLEDFNYTKAVFKDKYEFDECILDDMIIVQKYSDIIKLKIINAITLDVRTYETLNIFLNKTNIFAYANDTHQFLNKNPNHNFYGWYKFQTFNIKTRLKLFKEIHKTFESKGDNIFVSTLCGDISEIIKLLDLNPDKVISKQLLTHSFNLFKEINKVIYWHTGNLDRNNRIIIEAKIHEIELDVYLNSFLEDSIAERLENVKNGKVSEYFLNIDDILIQDFINATKIK